MGLFSWLSGKKKNNASQNVESGRIGADDGQSKYFKDETKPEQKPAEVKKEAPAVKPAEAKPEIPQAKKSSKSEKTSASEPVSAKKSTAEKAASKSPAKVAQPKAKNAAPRADGNPEKAVPKVAAQAEKTEPKQGRTGRFEIKKTKDDRFVFNLYAPNSVIVATSQVYSSSQAAVNGIESIIANAGKAPVEDQTVKSYEVKPYPKWELYVDNGGQYRFRLNASNGSCIVHSQGYTAKASCKNGIESIIRCSVNPEIDKSYLKKDK